MSIHDYPQSELAPRKLNDEEIEDPYQVIHNLFDFAHVPQIREQLWELLKMTVSGNYHNNHELPEVMSCSSMRSWKHS